MREGHRAKSRCLEWYLIVVKSLFGREFPSALVSGDSAVGLGTDPHQSACVTQQQSHVGAVLDRLKVLHALLKAGKALLPQLLLCHRHGRFRWRKEGNMKYSR